VWVAIGDVDGDGVNDIITGAGVGGGPRVRAFSLDGTEVANFFTTDSALRLGVTVAVGDLDGDGQVEVITGTGSQVNIYGGVGLQLVRSFNSGLAAPISVAIATGQILVGSGVGESATTRVFSATGERTSAQLAFEASFRGGARVATADVNGDGVAEQVVGAGISGGPRVRVVGVDGEMSLDFFAFDETLRGGVFVG